MIKKMDILNAQLKAQELIAEVVSIHKKNMGEQNVSKPIPSNSGTASGQLSQPVPDSTSGPGQ